MCLLFIQDHKTQYLDQMKVINFYENKVAMAYRL